MALSCHDEQVVGAMFTSAMLLCSGVVACACMRSIAPTTNPSEIVITRDQFGATVGVKVGQTISIPWSNSDNWRIEFASPPLELLKPDAPSSGWRFRAVDGASGLRSSKGDAPSSGWRFRAVAGGDTDIVLTLNTTGDAAPPRLAVTIQVTR